MMIQTTAFIIMIWMRDMGSGLGEKMMMIMMI